MFRYMALLWDPQQPAQRTAAAFLVMRIRAGRRWNEHWAEGLHIFFTGEEHGYGFRRLAGGRGAVLGTLFVRSSREGDQHSVAGTHLSSLETEKMVASGGRSLARDYWGNYIAFITGCGAGECSVTRDPSGTMPCHWSELSGVRVFFGSLADFAKLGIHRLAASERYLRARTVLPDRGSYVQSVTGIRSLHGGEQLLLSNGAAKRRFIWNPISLATSADLSDYAGAARHLRAETASATHAWASLHPSILLRLSGGLDSSIVLCCLRNAPSRPSVTGLTYYVPRGISDARPWARLAAGESLRIVEHARSVNLDLTRAEGLSPAVLPVSLFDYVETREPELRLAREMGATAIFNGQGGDSLFCRGAARHAAGDLLRRQILSAKLVRVACDAAILSDTTVWRVLARALWAVISGGDVADERLQQTRRLLANADVGTRVEGIETVHPWFRQGVGPSLSTALRLGSLLTSRPHYDPLGDDRVPLAISPLLSQPVIEACLRIPIHVHIQGGVDRGLARHAFAPDVHPAVLGRTWKDRAQGFLEHVLVSNRRYLREVLLDGRLVRDRLLDRAKVERALSESPGKRDGFLSEIFDHFDTELWLASLARGNASLH